MAGAGWLGQTKRPAYEWRSGGEWLGPRAQLGQGPAQHRSVPVLKGISGDGGRGGVLAGGVLGTIVALANQKGGVGKTTTAINLGAALAGLGKRVLLFDFDPQANSTAGLGMRPSEAGEQRAESKEQTRKAHEAPAGVDGRSTGMGDTNTAAADGAAVGVDTARAERPALQDDSLRETARAVSSGDSARSPQYDAAPRGTSYEVVVGGVKAASVIVATTIENLSIIAATPGLAGAEVELVPMMAREFRLKRALEPLREQFDYIIIDCPPSLGLLTVNALAAADEVIIPVQCEYLALEGLSQLTSTLQLVQRNLNPALKLRGLLLTMFDARTNLSQQVADEVRAHFPQTFKTVIPRSVRLSEAPSHGLSIFQYDGGSRAAKAYAELAAEYAGSS